MQQSLPIAKSFQELFLLPGRANRFGPIAGGSRR
jgi:hypothetical protein